MPDIATDKAAASPPVDAQKVLDQYSPGIDQITQQPTLLDKPMANLAPLPMNKGEQNIYAHHQKNLTGAGGVDNPDGSRSTVFAITVEIGGKTYVLPTVYDGQKLPFEEAIKRAEQIGFDNFPSYPSEEAAKARYDELHGMMEKDVIKQQGGQQ